MRTIMSAFTSGVRTFGPRRRRGTTLAVAAAICAGSACANDLVASIVKAPVVPDGDVAGAPTDLTINLDIDPDPAVPGLHLAPNERIEVTLPESFAFVDPEGYPVMNLFGSPDCSFERLACSTALLLHGWPQHPILPSFPPGETPTYQIGYDAAHNAVTITVRRPLADAPLPGPGVKQVHLMLLGFRNPGEGSYPIGVAIYDEDGRQTARGEGLAHIRASIAPSLNVTTIFDDNGPEPPNLNTIYQTTRPLQPTPLAWDFLAWNAEGEALDDLVVEQTGQAGGTLRLGETVVGGFTIDAPEGAEGQHLTGGPSIALDSEPVFGMPIATGHFTAQFTAGSQPGRYRTVLVLDGGDPVEMIVDVEE